MKDRGKEEEDYPHPIYLRSMTILLSTSTRDCSGTPSRTEKAHYKYQEHRTTPTGSCYNTHTKKHSTTTPLQEPAEPHPRAHHTTPKGHSMKHTHINGILPHPGKLTTRTQGHHIKGAPTSQGVGSFLRRTAKAPPPHTHTRVPQGTLPGHMPKAAHYPRGTRRHSPA